MIVTAYRYKFWKALAFFCLTWLGVIAIVTVAIVEIDPDNVALVLDEFYGGLLLTTPLCYFFARKISSKKVTIEVENDHLKISHSTAKNETEYTLANIKDVAYLRPKYGKENLHTIIFHFTDNSTIVFRNSAGWGTPRFDLSPLLQLAEQNEGIEIKNPNRITLGKFRPEEHMGQFDFFSAESTPTTDRYIQCKARIYPVWAQITYWIVFAALISIWAIVLFFASSRFENNLAKIIGTIYTYSILYYCWLLFIQPCDILIYEDRIVIRKQQRYFWQLGGRKTVYFKDVVRFVVTWPSGSSHKKIRFYERMGRTTYIREFRHLSTLSKTQPYYAEAYISKTLHRFIEIYQVNIKREYWEMDYSSNET